MAMDRLPDLCIDLIAAAHAALYKQAQPTEVAKAAARMAKVSRVLGYEILAPELWELLDPGCNAVLAQRQEEERHHIQQLQRLRQGAAATEVPVTSNSSLVDLKAACKQLGCGVTGPKAKLWENIQAALEKMREEQGKRSEVLDQVLEEAAKQPKFRCPVRLHARNVVVARRSAEVDAPRRLTVTEVRQTTGLKDEELNGLNVIYKRNPFYRSGPTMRLYDPVEVAQFVLKLRGPEPEGEYESYMDWYERLMAESAREETAARRKIKRTEDVKAMLQEHGLTEDTLCLDEKSILSRFVDGKGVTREEVRGHLQWFQ